MKNFTEIYNEYKPAIEKLNKQFNKLQKHTENLNATNLKLYDVAYYVSNDENLLNHFNVFCDFEFEYFEEYLKENMLEIEQIGRTSSFYFYGGYAESNFYDFNIYDMKDDENIFDTLGYGLESELEIIFNSDDFYQAYYNLENDLNYDLQNSDNLEELESEIETNIDDLTDYLQAYYKEIKAVKRAYKWLENYKANQVEYFKEFVENNDL